MVLFSLFSILILQSRFSFLLLLDLSSRAIIRTRSIKQYQFKNIDIYLAITSSVFITCLICCTFEIENNNCVSTHTTTHAYNIGRQYRLLLSVDHKTLDEKKNCFHHNNRSSFFFIFPKISILFVTH